MRIQRRLFIELVIFFTMLFCHGLEGAEVIEHQQATPVIITSDRVEFDNLRHEAVYFGNIKVIRGEMTLLAETLKVIFKKNGEGVDQIEVKGNVRIFWQDRHAEAQEGIYNSQGQSITLSGSPRLWDGDNQLKGDKIIYKLDENRVLIEGAVETILHLKGDTN